MQTKITFKRLKDYSFKDRLETLKDCIVQYENILKELEKKDKYWELKQYTTIWHYLDGLKLSYFILTHKD
jgi:hypothetical protein